MKTNIYCGDFEMLCGCCGQELKFGGSPHTCGPGYWSWEKEAVMSEYPTWICGDCGHKAQPDKRRIFDLSTWHKDKCGVCGKVKLVTEPRDFGYPTFDGAMR